MNFRKPANRWVRVPPLDDGLKSDSGAAGHHMGDWRNAARDLGQRLLPVMVLVAAAAVGLAAVAIS